MGASYRTTRQTATAYPVAGALSLGITRGIGFPLTGPNGLPAPPHRHLSTTLIDRGSPALERPILPLSTVVDVSVGCQRTRRTIRPDRGYGFPLHPYPGLKVRVCTVQDAVLGERRADY